MSDQRNRVILVGLILVVALAAFLLRPGPSGPGPDYEVAGRGALGLSGLAAGLESAGVHVTQSNAPELAPGEVTIEVAPIDVTHDEASAWMRGVRHGATMIYASGSADPFTRALGVRRVVGGDVTPTAARAGSFPDAQSPDFAGHAFTLAPGALAVLRAGSGAAFQVIPVGRGAVWLSSAPWYFTNAQVVPFGLPVALPIVWAHGRSARFDTYHQSGAGHLNALAYLPDVWTLVAIEAALAGLLILAALLRRPGPVWPEPQHTADLDGELGPSLAALYAKNRHAHEMAEALADDDARRLGARAVSVEGQLRRLREADDPQTAVRAWRELQDAERR